MWRSCNELLGSCFFLKPPLTLLENRIFNNYQYDDIVKTTVPSIAVKKIVDQTRHRHLKQVPILTTHNKNKTVCAYNH